PAPSAGGRPRRPPPELAFPLVKCRAADAVLAAHISCLRPCFLLLQDRDDLLLVEPASLHRPSPFRWSDSTQSGGASGAQVTREEACKRYLLSMEELATWQTHFDEYGMPGLLLKTIWQRRRQRAR